MNITRLRALLMTLLPWEVTIEFGGENFLTLKNVGGELTEIERKLAEQNIPYHLYYDEKGKPVIDVMESGTESFYRMTPPPGKYWNQQNQSFEPIPTATRAEESSTVSFGPNVGREVTNYSEKVIQKMKEIQNLVHPNKIYVVNEGLMIRVPESRRQNVFDILENNGISYRGYREHVYGKDVDEILLPMPIERVEPSGHKVTPTSLGSIPIPVKAKQLDLRTRVCIYLKSKIEVEEKETREYLKLGKEVMEIYGGFLITDGLDEAQKMEVGQLKALYENLDCENI